MKRHLRRVCSALFLAAAIAVIWILQLFIQVDDNVTYINWDSSVQIMSDGTEQDFSVDSYTNVPDFNGTYRFTGQLPEGLPAGSLLFETTGLDLTVNLDGRTIWQSQTTNNTEGSYLMAQAAIPLPEGTSGEVTTVCSILDSTVSMFPPMIRFVPENREVTETTALANREAFPAGAAALALVLIFGIFLLGILLREPDWSLIPLLLAATGLTFFHLIQSQGYYFLPENVYLTLSRPEVGLFILLALALYLIMNRRRQFWKYLGLAAAWSAGALLLCYLLSSAVDGTFATAVNFLLAKLALGQYDSVSYWLTLWLALTCALISAYSVVRSFADRKAREQGLLLENRRISENYQALEAWTSDAAARYHEVNHQLTALDCLYRNGNYQEMGEIMAQMRTDLNSHPVITFTANRTVNTILQNAAAQAKWQNIHFRAQANLPEVLNIPETDLCTLLINMLDNALEAASKVSPPEERNIFVQIKVADLYLAIHCENSFNGEIRTDKNGELLTTKENPSVHGYGIQQMKEIAKKYQSVIRFDRKGEHTFIAQTALRIPDSR